ncbi:GNAT family N-acetyltransferase [Novosphingobium sp. 1949]|uniref:GNAT family N-acetyltransferase n=1 Tax=Novosphingobium organovorum TaxID=2930092 RepID=A0ABT0B913_9SPHN|nr:GNAT family N-acetyltransferase [Novosphingobium organovorum]MCJ2181552.1 GNAT family N-acetyltransferase [Novosphingobium organovorum]
MDLREANANDAAALADLGQRSFVAKFGHLYTPRDLADFLADSHGEARVAAEIADPKIPVMLACEGERIVGFCKLKLACGWPDVARGGNVIELKQLYTDPDVIGRGIGGKLMAWALDYARTQGADEIQLSVYSDNPDAQRFYARHGFAKVAETYFMVGEQRDHEFLFAALI